MTEPRFRIGEQVACELFHPMAIIRVIDIEVQYRETPDERLVLDVQILHAGQYWPMKIPESYCQKHQKELF